MAGMSCTDDGGRGRIRPASRLVATVADLLAMHIQNGHPLDSAEVADLFLSLARGIDYAVANNEIPSRARDLPFLLKQVLRRMNDSSLQAVAMVLMISVKNACKIGWFLDHDATDLLTLAKEIGKIFSTMEDINAEPHYPLPNVPKIMSRYYPRLRMGHVLASLEVKPGYGAFVIDFHITRSMVSPAQKHICLFVAQTDNMDTSSCIVTPPQVNFLLNGKGVWGRINVSMDNGPQLPTNVIAMLRYGINLLQVVGQFNGNYVIIIAFMSVISTSGIPELQEYIQPVAVTSDSDLEIIEGQARISLNCPISFRRINIPVKGHLCKHHQCFDYGNFIEINSRRPSWRCPHCNQSVCNPDIRIDQNMVKILREVGENVVDVIISPDGSWKPVVESIDHAEQLYDATQSNWQENTKQCESVRFSSIAADAVDLTMGEDNDDDSPSNFRTEDMKPLWDDLQGFSAAEKIVSPGVNSTVEADQIISAHREDNLRTGVLLTPSSVSDGLAPPTTSLNAHSNVGFPRSTFSFMSSPVLTDAVSPSPYRETLDVHRETQVPIPLLQNQHFDPSNLQLQQSRLGSLIASNEYGRLASIPRHLTRNPIAVQALPAQDQLPRLAQHTRLMPTGATSTGSQTTSFMTPSVEGFDAVNGVTERDLQFSRSLMSSFPGQSVQRVGGLPNLRTTQAMNEPRNIVHPSIHVQSVQRQQRSGGSQVTGSVPNRQSPHAAAAQQTVQVSRSPPSVPVQLRPARTGTAFSVGMVAEQLRTAGEQRRNILGTAWSTPRPDASAALPTDENWRPSGRMRGSLTGEAYSAALSQFMLQPTQPTQAPLPPTSLPSNLPGGLPAFRLFPSSSNEHNAAPSQTEPQPRMRPQGGGSSGTLPEWTPRMP
ncbi:E4 SUMO-protein ligase PIAL2-like isoform X1 [Vitis riparia]|uniref:E4 SUMO-protein ligase PIAL2-like isoform X1 n=2 Tax=Vitis riparia TaxID=96939 RepID=UPI00155A9F77|nr:E4 SUMO-protein ligase PIAL2-like isoform X1 [Vitis riparia]